MLLWGVGTIVGLYVLWWCYDFGVRPRLYAARRRDEIRSLSRRSPEELRLELVHRAHAAGLAELYPAAPLFREGPVDSASELATRWDDTFALASKSDAEKNVSGPAGDVYLFYDFGLVTVREALDLCINPTSPLRSD